MGKKGGMLVAWIKNVKIKQFRKTDFCMEFQIENKTEDVSFWIVFMYASTDRNERQRQWEYLKKRK